MDKQNTIKIHTAKIDNHTKVIALDVDKKRLQFDVDYGEVGYPYPYIIIDEAVADLKTHEPRTDADRMALLEDGYTYCWYVTCPFTASDKYIAVYNPNGTQLTDSRHFFQTITEALDYVLDMEEGLHNG